MRTIWYMGAKTRMIGEVLQAIASADPCADTVLDLMSGTAVVSQALAPNYRVVSNDVQAYASSIARSYLCRPGDPAFLGALDVERDLGPRYREHHDVLLAAFAPAVALEDAFVEAWGLEPEGADPLGGPLFPAPSSRREMTAARRRVPRDPADAARAYRAFALQGTPLFHEDHDAATPGVWAGARELFTRAAIAARRAEPGRFPYLLASTYYPNVYLGVRQAIAVDSLRYAIDKIPSRSRFALAKRQHYLARAAPRLLGGDVGDQPLLPATRPGPRRRGQGRADPAGDLDPLQAAGLLARDPGHDRQHALPPRQRGVRGRLAPALRAVGRGPAPRSSTPTRPTTSDKYSRFYHALEVLTRYDYPVLQKAGRTKGRYPELGSRHRSAFCVKRRVEDEFRALARATAERGAALVLSYGEENGLLLKRYREAGDTPAQALRRFTDLAGEAYADVRLHRQSLMHSGQGDSNHQITELLLVARQPRGRAA